MFARALVLSLLSITLFSTTALADDDVETPVALLSDVNGDGLINILAFGDSITRGEGDHMGPDEEVFNSPPVSGEAGYPLRLEGYLHVPVQNRGVSGDAWTENGLERFIDLVQQSHSDITIIAEGSNDARRFVNPAEIYRNIQTALNVSRATGTLPLLMTLPPTCNEHAFADGTIQAYNIQIQLLAAVNEVNFVDIYRAFSNTCIVSECRLLNRPEGIHPNEDGYDVMTEAIAGKLLGVDVFAPEGPTLLAQALNVDPTTIKLVPDPVPAQ